MIGGEYLKRLKKTPHINIRESFCLLLVEALSFLLDCQEGIGFEL